MVASLFLLFTKWTAWSMTKNLTALEIQSNWGSIGRKRERLNGRLTMIYHFVEVFWSSFRIKEWWAITVCLGYRFIRHLLVILISWNVPGLKSVLRMYKKITKHFRNLFPWRCTLKIIANRDSQKVGFWYRLVVLFRQS